MNFEAFHKIIRAQKRYLFNNGWNEVTEGKFRVPKGYDIHTDDIYLLQRAFDFQIRVDAQELRKAGLVRKERV